MSKPRSQRSVLHILLHIFFRRNPKQSREQTSQLSPSPQRLTTDNPDAWRNYWKAQKPPQPWRTQPEITSRRLKKLSKRLLISPDIKRRVYPFKGMKLTRADIEWLLAMHEEGRGPVDWEDTSQHERQGLDLRGANLSGVDLSGLPLAKMRGGLAESQWTNTTLEQRDAAAVYLERAYLRKAHLEGADLSRVHLEGANLSAAHLEQAYLRVAHLEGADLGSAYLEGAYLSRARLEGAYLREAHLEGANLSEAHLEGASLRDAYLEGKCIRNEESLTMLHPADLRGAYFDNATNLEGTRLGDKEHGFIPLADVRWDSVNLAVVDWSQMNMLGDEYQARQMKKLDENVDENTKDKQLNAYRAAVRANRQLAVVLRDQGLSEEASYFAYRAQVLQRQVLLQRILQRHKLRIAPLLVVLALFELLLIPIELSLGFVLLRLPLPAMLLQLALSPLVLFAVIFLIVFLLLGYFLPKLLQLEFQNERESMLPLPVVLLGIPILLLALMLLGLLIPLLFLVFIVPIVYLLPNFLSPLALAFILSICLIYLLLRKYLSLFLMFFYALVNYGRYTLSLFLDLLAGYGYKPIRSLVAYLFIVAGFAVIYYLLGPIVRLPLTPLEAIVFSMASFHGRGFFPSNIISLSDPMVVLAAIEAVVGLIIEVCFIATFTQRFFGK